VGFIGSAIAGTTVDAPPDEPNGGHAFPAAIIYNDRSDGAYVKPWRRREDGVWFREDSSPPRRAEIGVGGFAALNERVYAHDFKFTGFLGLFVLQASYERFYEPLPNGSVDTLNLPRVHLGPNILGPHFKPVELYALFGGTGMVGPSGTFIPGFDVKLEGRVYPVEPLAFLASSTLTLFGEGKPLWDNRIEAGIAVGRFDFRGGMRALWQEPAQSFLGPVASVTLRL
jgi:hypothetical protein